MIIFGGLIFNRFIMTKKDFFRIIIKLTGIYWLLNSSSLFIPYIISLFSREFDHTYLISNLFYLLCCILIFLLLVFHTDKFIKWLKIEKGFDEDVIEFSNFNIENLMKLALIIFSFVLIVNNFATFVMQTYYVVSVKFHMNVSDTVSFSSQNDYVWAKSFIDLLVGYLILTNYPAISKYLLKITQKKEEIQ